MKVKYDTFCLQQVSEPVAIDNGTFCWEEGPPTLRNISLKVPEGSLVAIVGTVGSGKSSLLSAILGEMEKQSGRVNTKVIFKSKLVLLPCTIVHFVLLHIHTYTLVQSQLFRVQSLLLPNNHGSRTQH